MNVSGFLCDMQWRFVFAGLEVFRGRKRHCDEFHKIAGDGASLSETFKSGDYMALVVVVAINNPTF
jgi:hypothetical protein